MTSMDHRYVPPKEGLRGRISDRDCQVSLALMVRYMVNHCGSLHTRFRSKRAKAIYPLGTLFSDAPFTHRRLWGADVSLRRLLEGPSLSSCPLCASRPLCAKAVAKLSGTLPACCKQSAINQQISFRKRKIGRAHV